MGERLVAIGRRSAAARVAHLLLELSVRLEFIGQGSSSGFFCPLAQHDLANALGLTAIHVNRVLRNLRQLGLVVFSEFGGRASRPGRPGGTCRLRRRLSRPGPCVVAQDLQKLKWHAWRPEGGLRDIPGRCVAKPCAAALQTIIRSAWDGARPGMQMPLMPRSSGAGESRRRADGRLPGPAIGRVNRINGGKSLLHSGLVHRWRG